MTKFSGTYIVLCGGVGGSRLAEGLAKLLSADQLTIVVNTADDFDHLGLRICPDIDTVMYMLAGLVDQQRGWGRADETWAMMETMQELGGPIWFNLGDRDLALHLWRTELARRGHDLSSITRAAAARLGVQHRIVPATDDTVHTVLNTTEGELTFQDYFVNRRCEPILTGCRYDGTKAAKPAAAFLDALADPALRGIIIAPSNPFLSIGPMLAIADVAQRLRAARVPVVAISPLVGGKAVKGPALKILGELGYAPSVQGILRYYDGLIDACIVDERDDPQPSEGKGVRAVRADTLMADSDGRKRVAGIALDVLQSTPPGSRINPTTSTQAFEPAGVQRN